MNYIRKNGEWVPICITPQQLELSNDLTIRRKGEKSKRNSFRNNPLKIIMSLCNAYNVRFKLERNSESSIKQVKLNIPALEIQLESYGKSIRKAMQRMVYRLHYEYCLKILYFNPKD